MSRPTSRPWAIRTATANFRGRMYLYISPECARKVKQYHLERSIEKLETLLDGLTLRQDLIGIFSAAGPYVRRREAHLYRIYGKFQEVPNLQTSVVCLLDIYMKKDGREEELLDNIRRLGPERLDSLL